MQSKFKKANVLINTHLDRKEARVVHRHKQHTHSGDEDTALRYHRVNQGKFLASEFEYGPIPCLQLLQNSRIIAYLLTIILTL